METKTIKIYVFSAYSRAKRPIYIKKEEMTLKEFNNYIKDFRVKEFEENDIYRTKKDFVYSWKDGYINQLSD
jgi:hypothetical protein